MRFVASGLSAMGLVFVGVGAVDRWRQGRVRRRLVSGGHTGTVRRPPITWVGLAVGIALVVGLVVQPVIAIAFTIAIVVLPWTRRRRARRLEREHIEDEIPDVVELVHLGLGAGLNIRLALDAVVAQTSGRCRDHLAAALDRVDRGLPLADALATLLVLGEPARPFVEALVSSERYGTAVLEPLARVSDELRRRRQRRHEEQARRVPVKLVFPLVCCTLPALGLVTVVPVVARTVVTHGP